MSFVGVDFDTDMIWNVMKVELLIVGQSSIDLMLQLIFVCFDEMLETGSYPEA